MLVWLAEHLVKYYSGFNVFSYLTFRAIVSLLTALFISLWMGPRMIAHLQKLSFGQVVRNDGPESHFSKRGTPTMGGIMILTAIVISVLLWAYPSNPYVWCVLAVLIAWLCLPTLNTRSIPAAFAASPTCTWQASLSAPSSAISPTTSTR